MHRNHLVTITIFPFYLGNGQLSFSFFLFRFYIRNFEKIKKREKSNFAIIIMRISFSHRLSQLLISKERVCSEIEG